jgi:3-deoxy-D-manno-octulosonic-acid transferase
VGGSFVPIGGHNVLEPVSHKKAVIFGPFMENFSDISRSLKESGGGIQVHTKEEFYFHAKRLLENNAIRDNLGKKAFEVISLNQGAINKAMSVITQFI